MVAAAEHPRRVAAGGDPDEAIAAAHRLADGDPVVRVGVEADLLAGRSDPEAAARAEELLVGPPAATPALAAARVRQAEAQRKFLAAVWTLTTLRAADRHGLTSPDAIRLFDPDGGRMTG